MTSFRRLFLLIVLALAAPIIPFLLLGDAFEARIAGWFQDEMPVAARFAVIVGLLAIDIFLPIPSSVVSTYGGSVLGVWLATAASWIGMTIGATIAFALARLLGEGFAVRFGGRREVEQMAALSERYGPLAIVLTRALPILAEAAVLFLGATRLSWRRFLPAMAVTNFAIALTYAAFGAYFQGTDAFPAVLAASAILPLTAALLLRRWLPTLTSPDSPQQ